MTNDDLGSPVQGLSEAIPDRLAKQTSEYVVEYGVRSDDQAAVLHFYPPGTDWSEYPPVSYGKWNPAYQMHERLERALVKCFDLKNIHATYNEETASFCIIVRGLGNSLDPFYFIERFFSEVESPL